MLAASAAVVLGPVSIPIMCAVAGTSAAAGGASAAAIGTLIGGGVGAAAGTAETILDSKHTNKRGR